MIKYHPLEEARDAYLEEPRFKKKKALKIMNYSLIVILIILKDITSNMLKDLM